MKGPLICEYLNKHLAEYTASDREAFRRYSHGKAHARQGRTDLLGTCPHYDAGHAIEVSRAIAVSRGVAA